MAKSLCQVSAGPETFVRVYEVQGLGFSLGFTGPARLQICVFGFRVWQLLWLLTLCSTCKWQEHQLLVLLSVLGIVSRFFELLPGPGHGVPRDSNIP